MVLVISNVGQGWTLQLSIYRVCSQNHGSPDFAVLPHDPHVLLQSKSFNTTHPRAKVTLEAEEVLVGAYEKGI